MFGGNFDKVHNHYDKFMHKMKFYRVDEIKNIAKLKKCDKVLDIGGGTGYVAWNMIEECREIHVLDRSREMLSHVKENSKIVKCIGDAMDIPYDKGEFDVVIMSDILHHIDNQELLIEECKRVMKKGGDIIIHDFNKKYLKTKLLGIFEHMLFGKLKYRSIQEVKELLSDHGFSIKEVYDKGYYFMLSGELQ